jgi:hypothetical protein
MLLLNGLQDGLHDAVEQLLSLEKQNRLGEDVTGTKLCCAAVLDVLFSAGEWKLLCENILLLAKRRSQLKQVRHVSRLATFASHTADAL